MRDRRDRRHGGFGLLFVVMLILGLSLTAGSLVVTGYFLTGSNNVPRTQMTLRNIAIAISGANLGPLPPYGRHYEQDVGALPTTLNDLVTKPAGVAACRYNGATQTMGGWCGPYWSTTFSGERAFVDDWGAPLVYSSASRLIYSKGPNGADDGGTGDDIVQNF